MKGYIKIESSIYEGKEGLSVKTDLRDVSYMDRIAVINSVCHALHITPTELKLMAGLISSGFMEEMTDTVTLEDETEVARKPETKKKKLNVHVIGLDADSDDIAELLKELLS